MYANCDYVFSVIISIILYIEYYSMYIEKGCYHISRINMLFTCAWYANNKTPHESHSVNNPLSNLNKN